MLVNIILNKATIKKNEANGGYLHTDWIIYIKELLLSFIWGNSIVFVFSSVISHPTLFSDPMEYCVYVFLKFIIFWRYKWRAMDSSLNETKNWPCNDNWIWAHKRSMGVHSYSYFFVWNVLSYQTIKIWSELCFYLWIFKDQAEYPRTVCPLQLIFTQSVIPVGNRL